VISKLQRWYALSVFLLRDFIRNASDGRFVEAKVQLCLTMSQLCLIIATVFLMSRAVGHLPEGLRSNSGFLTWVAVVSITLYFVNDYAEQRLPPRFEDDFRSLGRTARFAGTIGVLLFVILSFVVVGETAVATRGLR
jgi:hypothetical protein